MAEEKKTLYRLPKQGQIFGVCAGLAEYFDMDVTLVRIIFIILVFATGGAMIFIYLLMALVLPVKNNGENKDDTIGDRVHTLGQELHRNRVINKTRNYLGIGLLVVGIWLLLEQIFPDWFDLRWSYVWPVLIILAGLLIIVRRSDG